MSKEVPFSYPPSPREPRTDEYHGVEVADPYRWLEDSHSPATREWVAAQNRLTRSFLDRVGERDRLHRRLRELWNHPRCSAPVRRGGRYFYERADGLQNQSVIQVLDALDGAPRVLLDPNLLAPDGTVSLADWEPSWDGRYLVYGVSTGGSDWTEWRVREVDSGRDLPDRLHWSKFSSASWSRDNRGFYYSRYAAPRPGEELAGVNYNQRLHYHRLGDDGADDALVYERPDRKEWGFDGHVSTDGRFLIIHVWQGTERRNRVYYQPLDEPGAPVVPLLDDFDASYDIVGSEGSRLWFLTDRDAPRGRLVEIDLEHPEPEHWREIIPEREDTLESVQAVGDGFVTSHLSHARARLHLFGRDGEDRGPVELPEIGSVTELTGEPGDPEAFFTFTSFSRPPTVYRLDAESGETRVFHQPEVAFDPDEYCTKQVFYPSADGTRIPLFLVHHRDVEPDRNTPALLYGYGGFNVSVTPSFAVHHLAWMERGGLFAVANLRGGGEYGREWHDAGKRLRKQNVFDDFIGAASYLVDNGLTAPKRLSVFGRSNGGLLIGAAITQRPDLFGAALIHVGVLDMLRFHRFTIGWAWISDYGSPEDPEEFQALHAYSPYHKVREEGVYPATLVTTADHDDRVVPAHSYKFTAALQATRGARHRPVLIRVDDRAGHGAGKPTSKMIDEAADSLAFLLATLDLPDDRGVSLFARGGEESADGEEVESLARSAPSGV